MKYGLSKATIDKICGVFAQFPEVQKAVLYGSRANGGYKTGSDIDLTLYGTALTSRLRGDIAELLDDLLLPYSIDLSLFDELENDKLREHIKRVGVVFYERGEKGGVKSGWEVKRLGEVCEEIFAGGDVPKDNSSKIKTDAFSIPIFSNGEKNKGLYGYTNITRVTKPSITISARGTIGYSEIRGDAFYPAIRLIVVIPKITILDLSFLKFVISSIDFTHSGSSIPQLTVPMIKEYPIPLPPLHEQQQIVAILDEAFAAIHKAKENAEKNLKNARELFESYLQSVFANAGDGWEEKSVKDITEVKNGYAFASKDFKATNAIKSIKITNVGVKEFVEEVDNYLPEKYTETFKDFQVREGNIVIALTRTIIAAGLKVAVVPQSYNGALINQRVAALVPNEKLVNQRYLYNFLTTDGVAKYVLAHVNTLMQPNLSINDLKNLPVPLAPLKTQERIVTKLDSLSLETKKLEDIYRKKLASLEELKKSLLQKAFSGQLSKSYKKAV